MQDVIYLLSTVGCFALMWLFVIGCDRIIGTDDETEVHPLAPSEITSVAGGRS